MKYELIEDSKLVHEDVIPLYRIRALKDFANVKKGDVGGYIESESNLSHDGDCWVYDNAKVYDSAIVSANAMVSSEVLVFDKARIGGDAHITHAAMVFNDAVIFGTAFVTGSCCICDNAMVFGDVTIDSSIRIGGDAAIRDDDDHLCISSTRMETDVLSVYRTMDGSIKYTLGSGVLDYRYLVNMYETCSCKRAKAEWGAIIELIKIRFDI